jgi:hypothetical protein
MTPPPIPAAVVPPTKATVLEPHVPSGALDQRQVLSIGPIGDDGADVVDRARATTVDELGACRLADRDRNRGPILAGVGVSTMCRRRPKRRKTVPDLFPR